MPDLFELFEENELNDLNSNEFSEDCEEEMFVLTLEEESVNEFDENGLDC